jgi:hypothetical protein
MGHARQPKTVIFWGAGATQKLGIRTTADQEQFILRITAAHDSTKSLKHRVTDALGSRTAKHWHGAFFDLITILGDGDDAYTNIEKIEDEQTEAMRRNWKNGATPEELHKRIIDLRLTYDWPALKSVVRVCPGSATGRMKLNDLFNLLDMHISPGSGFRAPFRSSKKNRQPHFFDTRRLVGAKNALLLILIASFYTDYQECIASKQKTLQHYRQFIQHLARRIQRKGVHIATHCNLDEPFYQSDVSFVSLNYDPILLWLQFIVNRTLNKSKNVARITSSRTVVHLFHDFGHLIPARRIGRPEDEWPWYPLNEGAAQRLNELKKTGLAVRLTKFLFPHGCLCWRECPDCGKLSAYHGDEWSPNTSGLFPPPPLRAFDPSPCAAWITGDEHQERERGKVDARKCLHCGTLTFAHHTQALMQSSFKPRPPSFIEEIQRELRATTMQANHMIFMGYSLPPDDVIYRAFFSARRQRQSDDEVRCTVIGKDKRNPHWYGPTEVQRRIQKGRFSESAPVVAACDIFGGENVRFYGGGIPEVFLDKGRATSAKLKYLLKWSAIV